MTSIPLKVFISIATLSALNSTAHAAITLETCVSRDRQVIADYAERVRNQDKTLLRSAGYDDVVNVPMVVLTSEVLALQIRDTHAAHLGPDYVVNQEMPAFFAKKGEMLQQLQSIPAEVLGMPETKKDQIVSEISASRDYNEFYDVLAREKSAFANGKEEKTYANHYEMSILTFDLNEASFQAKASLIYPIDAKQNLANTYRAITATENALAGMLALNSCEDIQTAVLQRNLATVKEIGDGELYSIEAMTAQPGGKKVTRFTFGALFQRDPGFYTTENSVPVQDANQKQLAQGFSDFTTLLNRMSQKVNDAEALGSRYP